MKFDEVSKRAIEIRNKYDELNKTKRGVIWNEQQLMSGFVGDVGDLSKIIMAKHGLRAMDDVDAKVAPGVVVVIPPETAHFTLPKENLVLAVINTPPFNPNNVVLLEDSNASVGFDRGQYAGYLANA